MAQFSFQTQEVSEILYYYKVQYESQVRKARQLEEILDDLYKKQEKLQEAHVPQASPDPNGLTDKAVGFIKQKQQEPGYAGKTNTPAHKASKAKRAAFSQKNETQNIMDEPQDEKYQEIKKEIEELEWDVFLETMLNDKKTLMHLDDFYDYCISKLKLPTSHETVIRNVLEDTLSMMNYDRTVKKYKIPKDKRTYYGLKEWFHRNHKPKSEYFPNWASPQPHVRLLWNM